MRRNRGIRMAFREEDVQLVALSLQLALNLKTEGLPSLQELEKEGLALERSHRAENPRDLIQFAGNSLKRWLIISLLAARADLKDLSSMVSGGREEKILAACGLFLKGGSSIALFRPIIEGSDENLLLATLLLLMTYVQRARGEEVVKEFERWLKWPDVQVRISAVKLLSSLASKMPDASERILNKLLDAFDNDPNLRVRESIATQIGIMGTENPSLRERSYSALLSLFRKERSARVRKAILDSLLSLG